MGTRPEIIRLAAVINKCRKYFDCILAHTGQNYDYNLNGVFFKDLKLSDPEVYMDAVGEDLDSTMGNIINAMRDSLQMTHPLDVSGFKTIDKSDLTMLKYYKKEEALNVLYKRKMLLKR